MAEGTIEKMRQEHENELRQAQNEVKRLKLESRKATLEGDKSPIRNNLGKADGSSLDLSRVTDQNNMNTNRQVS